MPGPSRRLNTRRVFRVAIVCAAVTAVVAVWALSALTLGGQIIDTLAMIAVSGFSAYKSAMISVLHTTISYAGLGAVLIATVLIAVIRKRWQLAIRAVAIVAGANITTQLLKTHLFGRPALLAEWSTPPSLPSGHTTAAAATAAALVIVVPVAWRSWAALAGSMWTFFVGITTVLNDWHRPSDVIAAILVVIAWTVAMAPAETGVISAPRVREWMGVCGYGLLLAALVLSGVVAVIARPRVQELTTTAASGPVRFDLDQWHQIGMIAGLSATLLTLALSVLAMFWLDSLRRER